MQPEYYQSIGVYPSSNIKIRQHTNGILSNRIKDKECSQKKRE